eukprot:c32481_g1_i1 orf=56-340(+)
MLNTSYKILAKVLANRISHVIKKLVNKEQKGFIIGRHMIDHVANVWETVYWALETKSDSLIVKLDFEKAYDHIEWSFIEAVMMKLGFGPHYMRW